MRIENNATALLLALLLLVMLTTGVGAQAPSAGRRVFINGALLSDGTIRDIEMAYRVRVADGRYWYDARSGAWGVEGGPTAGLILAGVPLGGPLREDASAGTTGVVVNGRRLPVADLVALQQLTGPIQPGRYWVDEYGNAGYEGGPALVNLHALAASSRSSAWSHYTRSTDASVGGDGDFFYYIDRTTSMTCC